MNQKYLRDYINDEMSKIFEKYGAFYAFTNSQFAEKRKKGIEYSGLGAGLICPKNNCSKLLEDLDNIIKLGVTQDLKENGKEKIIIRELDNHEAFWSGDIESTVDALEGYNITWEEVKIVFKKQCEKFGIHCW